MRYDVATQMFERASQLIEGASSIAVSGHTDPDGDALGSVLSMVGIIERAWPGKSVTPLLANDRPIPANLAFLPGCERFVPACRFDAAPDLFIGVDTPTAKRLADSSDVLARARRSFSFDHHPAVEDFCQESYSRPEAAACAEVVFEFARHLGVEFDSATATCLLTALITDTGSFQYQNAGPQALRHAADLVEAGARPDDICLHVFQSKTLPQLKLQQLVLGRLELACSGELAHSYILQSDLARVGATAADCDDLVDCIRKLGSTRAVLFLREVAEGQFRGNLRSKDPSCDVSLLARAYGGGGHKMASGFSVEGPVDVTLARLTASFEELCCGDEAR